MASLSENVGESLFITESSLRTVEQSLVIATSSPESNGHPQSQHRDTAEQADSEEEPKVREWSRFELQTACALICRYGLHGTDKPNPKKRARRGIIIEEDSDDLINDRVLRFATRMNKALYGRYGSKHDILIDDIHRLMEFLEAPRNKNVMAYLKRQPVPFIITRLKTYVFKRLCVDFNRAFYDWNIKRPERLRNEDPWIDEEAPQSPQDDRRKTGEFMCWLFFFFFFGFIGFALYQSFIFFPFL